jgi:putative nucleotidyltransferase with HDIG domain
VSEERENNQPFRINSKHVIIVLFALVVAAIIHVRVPYWIPEYRAGDIATGTIRAPYDVLVSGTGATIKKGELIVTKGRTIGPADLQKLSALRTKEELDSPITERFLFLFLILLVSVIIIYHFAEKNIRKFSLSDKDLTFCLLLTTMVTLLVKLCMVLFEQFLPDYAQDLFYVIPIFAFGMVMRVVLFSEVVFIFSTILGAAVAFALGNGLSVFLYVFLGNVLAAYFTGKCEKRTVVLKAGFYTSVIMAFMVVMFHSLLGYPISSLPVRIVAILVGGISSSFITLGLLPVIEHVFGFTTDIKLLEMANLEHPLLGEMMIKAPGTYHHSIIVGNLSKAAAESIGAHPILTRVAAYYHDIGKLKMPHYYIENRSTFEDAHDGLSPHMSALIILSHVKEGIELADKFRLGKKIEEMIKQHHGTTIVNHFYNRAKELEDPQLYAVQEIDFRYMGPKPQTKEAGILMLADAVEAASRTLDNTTPRRIETLVQRVIENVFIDGQLDDCELTLKDLHAIQRSFTTILLGIFHHRIQYPERMENGGFDKRFPKVVRSGQGAGKKSNRRLISLFGPRQ